MPQQPGQPQSGQPEQPGHFGQQPGQPGQPGQPQPVPPQPGQYEQQQWGQQPPGQPFTSDPTAVAVAPGPGPQPKKSKRGLIITLVAVLVLALGGGATWWALSRSDSVASGAATPEDAVTELLSALDNGDLLGAANTLAPSEASILADQLTQSFDEYKRLGLLDQNADPSSFSGFELVAENLTFDSQSAERVNDHVTITKLTGGTLTINADLTKLPLAQEYLDAMLAEAGGAAALTDSETLDIGSHVQQTGEPIRIATVNVDGEWYPSLLYTFADNLLAEAGLSWPQESIPAHGADSPTEAVKQLLQAAFDANFTRVIELLPPDEMAVLHDVGPALVHQLGNLAEGPSGIQVLDVQTEDKQVAGGTLATLTALSLEIPGQGQLTVTKNGDCYELTAPQGTQQLCGEELGQRMAAEADESTPPQMLQHIGESLAEHGVGAVVTQVDGQYYVSPLRTLNELGMSLSRGLEPEDLKQILQGIN
jgi:hypothetical protein